MQLLKNIKWLLPICLVFGIVIFYASSLNEIISFKEFINNYSELKEYTKTNKMLSYGLFILLYILIVAFSIPIASLLTICGGSLFGWEAFFLIIFSATIGSTIVFVAAKTIFYEFFKNKTNAFQIKLENGFKKNDFLYLISLRLIPLVPFWVVNVIPAFFNMRLKLYFLGTFFGIAPGTFVYVWFSIGFEKILTEGNKPDFSIFNQPTIIGSFTAFGLLILLPILIKKHKS